MNFLEFRTLDVLPVAFNAVFILYRIIYGLSLYGGGAVIRETQYCLTVRL